MIPPRSAPRGACLLLAGTLTLAGCGSPSSAAPGGNAPTAGAGPTSAAPATTSPAGPLGGATAAADALAVVASTNVYAGIVSAIGGRHVQVVSFISDPNADPHSYEASARNQLALSGARLVIENGAGYDDFMDRMLAATSSNNRQLVIAAEVSGHSAAKGADVNPHVWYDFAGMDAVAARITDDLARADPLDGTEFRTNAKLFRHGLLDLRSREEAIRAAHEGTQVAITEPVPGYLLAACGLTNDTPEEFSKAIEDGTDVPAVLAKMSDLMNSHQVKELFYNAQTTSAQTEQLKSAATAAGVVVVPVTETMPPDTDYLAWMNHNLDALEAGLR